MEKSEKVVRERWLEVARVQLFGEGEEGLRFALEVGDFEDGFGVGKGILC